MVWLNGEIVTLFSAARARFPRVVGHRALPGIPVLLRWCHAQENHPGRIRRLGGSWLQFIHESPDWELARLVSRGGSNLERARKKWNLDDDQCCESLEDALERPGDVVIISTAPSPKDESANSCPSA